MKATVDLPEDLLADVRAAAEKRGWTVRAVFEESLRNFLDGEKLKQRGEPFRLAHTVVRGTEPVTMTFAEMLEATNLNRRGE